MNVNRTGASPLSQTRFGRKPKLTTHQRAHALKMLDAGEPQAAVARVMGVDQSTISRLLARLTA